MFKVFYLVRHGESLGNIGMSGSANSPLSPKGRLQASYCAKYLFENNKEKTLIISSPFLRCCQTAQIISEKTQSNIMLEPLLHEIFVENFFPNKIKFPSLREIASSIPNAIGTYGNERWMPDKYETADDLLMRAGILRNRLLGGEFKDWNIICVGHWASLAALLKSMCDVEITSVSNCSVSKIVFNGSSFSPDFLNETSFIAKPDRD
jgi:broad specificity phosphatase PhoE